MPPHPETPPKLAPGDPRPLRPSRIPACLGLGLAFGCAAGVTLAGIELSRQGYLEKGLGHLASLTLRSGLRQGIGIGLGVAVLVASLPAAASLLSSLGSRLLGWDPGRAKDRVQGLFASTLLALGILGLAALRWDSVRPWLNDQSWGHAWLRAGALPRAGGLGATLGALAVILYPVGAPLGRVLLTRIEQRLLAPLFRSTAIRPLAILAAAVGLCAEGIPILFAPKPGPERPNIVFITIDTLRADHLSCYGHRRPTSPSIDRLADRGILFEDALSQAPWTLPSMASLHTSLYPSEHGANKADRPLRQGHDTLAEALRNEGYRTLGIVSHWFVSDRFGFDQGYEHFDDGHVLGHEGLSSERLTRAALEATEDSTDRPTFLWVHYFDPHFTYVRHRRFGFAGNYRGALGDRLEVGELGEQADALNAEDLDYIRDVYDEEIAHTDAWIGELLAGLEERLDPSRPTIFVLTADHGEYFLERGRFDHGGDVYRELVHVPLLIGGDVPEGQAGTRIRGAVETRSVTRTIAALAGADAELFSGQDLLDREAESTASFVEGNFAFSEGRQIAIVRDGWKLIRDLDDGFLELYDLQADPAESVDRIDDTDEELRLTRLELEAELGRFGESIGEEGPQLELSEEELEHLRSLGYIK